MAFTVTNFNYEIIYPETTIFDSSNTCKIVFAEAQAGYATFTFGSANYSVVNESIIPDADNTRALGSGSKRWTTLHSAALNTGDIVMKNENGHFTIDEQNEYLRVYNHRNGKYYKLVMQEI